MLDFAKEWQFECKTSSPTYGQSNGFIERHIQSIKSLLKKSTEDNKDLYLTLLEYRNTPLERNSYSPAQLLFNRRLNGILPMTNSLLKPKIPKSYQNKLQEKQIKQKNSTMIDR